MGILFLVGLGLYDEKGLSLRGLEVLRRCSKVYLELYTSPSLPDLSLRLEGLLGRELTPLSREEVEDGTLLVAQAALADTALLVSGDPMAATTHQALRLRALKSGVPVKIVHGASILTAAAGLLGLQSTRFGRVVTLPSPRPGFDPESPYRAIQESLHQGLHTLVLLDSGNPALEATRALELLRDHGVIKTSDWLGVVGNAGSEEPLVVAGPLDSLLQADLGSPPQAIVVCATLHFLEEESLASLRPAPSTAPSRNLP